MRTKRPAGRVSGPKRRKAKGRALPDKAKAREAFEQFARIVASYVASLDPGAPAGESGRVMLRNKWPDKPEVLTLLARLTRAMLWAYGRKANDNEQVALAFLRELVGSCELLSAYAEESAALSAIAPHVLRWPAAISARPEYASERKQKLAMIGRLEVGGRHPARGLRPLRGGLGKKVKGYLYNLEAAERLPGASRDLPRLPPLSAKTLGKYRAAAWGMFLDEHGEKFERHADLAHIAAEKVNGQTVAAGRRRDIIRDAWEESFKTLARQLERAE